MLKSNPLNKFLFVCIALFSFHSREMKSQDFSKIIFESGTNGYHTYRIPAIVVTNKGSILAFCEGRKDKGGDDGNIDLLLKRSFDNGNTWSDMQIIWNDSNNTCGNPCPIVDISTGAIHLLVTWNRGDDKESKIINGTSTDTRRIFTTTSYNDGKSWTTPKEITKNVKKSNWTWYATGPGAGIQIEKGKFKERLIAPCDHIEAITKDYYSHIIYSDNHGQTWNLGGSTPMPNVNECKVIEISRNQLMLNMRNYDRMRKVRQTSISFDGGNTWTDQKFETNLIEPICQAGFLASFWNSDSTRKYLMFSNPSDSTNRINMTIKVSLNEGKNWHISKTLHSGPSAYSDLALVNNKYVACLFECGEKHPYEKIEFNLISIAELVEK